MCKQSRTSYDILKLNIEMSVKILWRIQETKSSFLSSEPENILLKMMQVLRTSRWSEFWDIRFNRQVIEPFYWRWFCKELLRHKVSLRKVCESVKPTVWTEWQYKGGDLILQKMLKLSFPRYSASEFTVHWLLMSQLTSPLVHKRAYFHVALTSDFEVLEKVVDVHWFARPVKGIGFHSDITVYSSGA